MSVVKHGIGFLKSVARFVVRSRRACKDFISVQDLYEIPRLMTLGVWAWILPETMWAPLSHRLAQLNVAMHPSRTRKEVEEVKAFLAEARCNTHRVVVENWANRYEERLQYLRAWRPGGWTPKIDVTGEEHISAAFHKGHGIVFISGLFSFHWLIPKMALHRLGVQLTHFSVPLHGFSRTYFGVRFLNRFYRDIENRYIYERLITKPQNIPIALQRMRERLKANGAVHFAIGGRGRRTVAAMFLGSRIVIATGPFAMAHTMGAALLPLHVLRLAPTRFEVIVGRRIDILEDGDGNVGYAEAVQTYADAVAPYVLRDPGQWRGWHLLNVRKPWGVKDEGRFSVPRKRIDATGQSTWG